MTTQEKRFVPAGFEVWFVTPKEKFKISEFLEIEFAFVAAAKFLKRIGFTAVSVENTFDFQGGPAIKFATHQKDVLLYISGGILTEGEEKTPLEPGESFTSQIGKAINEDDPPVGPVYVA